MKPKVSSELEAELLKHLKEDRRAWHEKYAVALDSPYTVECECGESMLGDSPAIGIQCFLCFSVEAQSERDQQKQ